MDRGDTSWSDRLNPTQTYIGRNRPRVPTRVYALDQKQVSNAYEVVKGTIPIFHRLTKILIDPDVTHYFVNPNFICTVDVKIERLLYDLEVRTPISDQYFLANKVY